MKIPFVDLKAQYLQIKDEVLSELENVCENTAFILGPHVKKFEENFAKYVNTSFIVGVNSGTAANQLAVQAFIKPGDEVITSPNTFIATTESITAAGGKVVFADIDENSFNLDPNKIEAAITPRTKAIVAVHLYGQPADMDAIMDIARKYDLVVIEDAAQAHGAEYKGKKAGSIGHAAAFSFYPGKNLGAYGEAGAIATNLEKVAEFAQLCRDHGSREKYMHEMEGYNMRMAGFQGAVLNVKLKYLDAWIEARRKNAGIFNNQLSELEEVQTPQEMAYSKHVYHLYVIRVKDREGLQQHLAKHGIASGFHYKYPLHLQKAYTHLGYKKGDFPVTEAVMEEIISLPMFPELTEEQIIYISKCVREFITN